MGYENIQDLPRTNKNKMKFFQELAPDKGMEILVKKALNLEALRFSMDLFVGRAFDITRDKITSFNVFTPSATQNMSTIGCYIPDHVHASDCPQVQFTYDILQSKDEMVKQRLKQLNIQLGTGEIKFNYQSRNGFNVFNSDSTKKMTAVYEKHLIKLEVMNNSDTPISEDLKRTVQQLPTTYNKKDVKNVEAWTNFFKTYGTHYVSTSFIGGSIVFEINNVDDHKVRSTFTSNSGGINAFLGNIFGGDGYSSSSSDSLISALKKNINIIILGGNSAKASDLVTSQNQEEFLNRLHAWEETILENPMVTDSSISLREMADVINRIQPNIVHDMKTAILDLYNTKLKYEVPCSEPTRQADRQANKSDGGSNCLMPQTLILTPKGQVLISELKMGDTVLNGLGQQVKVLGVNKVYSIGNQTQIYGFKDTELGEKPFFTGGHTFLAPFKGSSHKNFSKNLLVANKLELKKFHPQMKTEFCVQEMPKIGGINLTGFNICDFHPNVTRVPQLTLKMIKEGQELYFLAVQGNEGTYIANGLVCYHELPNFAAWPRTFEVIGKTAASLTKTEEEINFESFLCLRNLAIQISHEWKFFMENNISGQKNNEKVGHMNTKNLSQSSCDETVLGINHMLEQLPKILNNSHSANFGMFLYAMSGETLHQYLDVLVLNSTPLIEIADRIIIRQFN